MRKVQIDITLPPPPRPLGPCPPWRLAPQRRSLTQHSMGFHARAQMCQTRDVALPEVRARWSSPGSQRILLPGVLQGMRRGACHEAVQVRINKATDALLCRRNCSPVQMSWADHKKVHKKAANGWLYVTKRGQGRAKEMPSFVYTGTIRPDVVSPTQQVGVAQLISNHCLPWSSTGLSASSLRLCPCRSQTAYRTRIMLRPACLSSSRGASSSKRVRRTHAPCVRCRDSWTELLQNPGISQMGFCCSCSYQPDCEGD